MPNDRERDFLTLVHDNDARLRRIAHVYAHDPEARKDLHQEMLLQLWRSLPSFTGASSPNTWVYRVALNTALAWVRRQDARPEAPLEEDDPGLAHDAHDDDRLDAADRSAQLHAAIGRLNSVDKMLVTMYLDDRSYQAMADVVGITADNVGVKLHRVRKLLARWLTTEDV